MAAAATSVEIGLYCASVAIQYGLPALLALLSEFQKVDPTMSDLVALRGIPIDPDAA